MITAEIRKQAALSLFEAEANRKVIPQLSKTYPAMTLEDAYDVQRRCAALRLKAGAKTIGRKIGLTSRAMQMASNFNEPDYGIMFDDAQYATGATIPAGRFIKPRLETELAFIMGADLKTSTCSNEDVLAATAFVTPALEIIDYRTEVPRAIVDTIADNAAYGAIVVSGRHFKPHDLDLRWVAATLAKNGTIEESGVSAAVMGHPAAGVAWLVNKLAAMGDGLKKGEIVLAGSFTRPVDIKPGDAIVANYNTLGKITVSFS